MPNWCNNLVEVQGPAEDIAAFKLAAADEESSLLFRKLLPYPGEWDYDWCVEHWGTKWDADGAQLIVDDPNQLVYRFGTAWSPPVALFENLRDKYPTLHFHGVYAEPGMDFSGTFDIGAGPQENVKVYIPSAVSLTSDGIDLWEPVRYEL